MRGYKIPAIGKKEIQAAYRLSKQVFEGQLAEGDAVQALIQQHGMNRSSAAGYVRKLAQLLGAETYTRTMNTSATEYYLQKILIDFGSDGLVNALTALGSHIEYYESLGRGNLNSLRQVYDRFSKRGFLQAHETFEANFQMSVSTASGLSKCERAKLLPEVGTKATKLTVKTKVFRRNPHVVVEVLLRADGKCERCRKEAPFQRRKDDSPYLEVHHKKMLSNDGDDTVENATALCPNCHRELHYG